ncbi:exodeoxyribonuclease VII large subunit, partial [candidate division KSB1 bacterium]|nr:exodeoxyribonuclease VII large subunit [candidate division KSB1 bacterium]
MDSKNRHTVSEITKIIKLTLEDRFYSVWIEGEISDFKRHSSGHLYFILKDENAQLSAVMWRGKSMSLPFVPQDGIKVLAKGNITVFERSGRYQLDVDILQPLGIGNLQMAFEQLKIRLKNEGLF